MLHRLIDYARSEKIGCVEGIVLADNEKRLAMCRESGFGIEIHPDEPGANKVTLVLRG